MSRPISNQHQNKVANALFRHLTAPACIGCGWCCLTDQCHVSHEIYGYLPRCPELVWNQGGGRYACRLMGDPERGAEYRHRLLTGQGCCARDNPFRADVRNRDSG